MGFKIYHRLESHLGRLSKGVYDRCMQLSKIVNVRAPIMSLRTRDWLIKLVLLVLYYCCCQECVIGVFKMAAWQVES